jgi:hypothetical protein
LGSFSLVYLGKQKQARLREGAISLVDGQVVVVVVAVGVQKHQEGGHQTEG